MTRRPTHNAVLTEQRRLAALRRAAEAQIERLIDLLDMTDIDADDEADSDDDTDVDREADGADDEPSLGWPEGVVQEDLGCADDREVAAEPVVTAAGRRAYQGRRHGSWKVGRGMERLS